MPHALIPLRQLRKACLLVSLLCLSPALLAATENAPAKAQETVRKVIWNDLMPPFDEKILERYERDEIPFGEMQIYMTEHGSKVVDKLNNVYAKVPGYLVPLNMNKKQMATEFLLVPTMGACIHVPPPPPNQIVYVTFPEGLKYQETAYTPYWVYGKLKTEKKTSEYSDAMYSMKADRVIEYQ